MTESELYRRIIILDRYLEQVLHELRGYDVDVRKAIKVIYNCLSVTGQLQEIMEEEAEDRPRGREGKET